MREGENGVAISQQANVHRIGSHPRVFRNVAERNIRVFPAYRTGDCAVPHDSDFVENVAVLQRAADQRANAGFWWLGFVHDSERMAGLKGFSVHVVGNTPADGDDVRHENIETPVTALDNTREGLAVRRRERDRFAKCVNHDFSFSPGTAPSQFKVYQVFRVRQILSRNFVLYFNHAT